MARSSIWTGYGRARGPGRAAHRPLARRVAELTGFGEGAPGRVVLHTVSLIRWVAVIGQLFTILFVHFSLGIALPLAALLPAVALSALVNLALGLGLKATTRLPSAAPRPCSRSTSSSSATSWP